MSKTNQEIAAILYEMSELFAMNNVPFKPQAFEKAARSVEYSAMSVADTYQAGGRDALQKIPGVGEGIAERIAEFLDGKKIKDYSTLKKQFPINLSELGSVEGLGPKIIKLLYQKLKIKNLKDLEYAARGGKLRNLPRFGEKLEAKILKGIEFQKKSAGRQPLGVALPYARKIAERLKNSGLADDVFVAGSIIRWQETVGDIDILAASRNPKAVTEFFASMPEVQAVIAKGETKSEVRLKIGIDSDLRVIPKESFGAATQYFVGDKNHNVAIRALAVKKGYKLNEYGLYRGSRRVAGEDEQDIYHLLGLDWVPFELRQDNGEIELARKHALPKLVGFGDVRGDLQVQTSWTDGENSIEEMAREAERLGREYIAITDHTKALAMTGGSDEKKLLRQTNEIAELNKKLRKEGLHIKILSGAEVNILKDGSLDITDAVLAKLDVVGAAVHSLFNLPAHEQTSRIIRAMENKNVDILFHPTGRVLQKRPAYDLDMDAIYAAARRTGTILEIDGHPWRLDLKDEHIREAKKHGCKFVVDTDAHAVGELSYIEYGIGQARRAGLEKKDILNTLPLREFLSAIDKGKKKKR